MMIRLQECNEDMAVPELPRKQLQSSSLSSDIIRVLISLAQASLSSESSLFSEITFDYLLEAGTFVDKFPFLEGIDEGKSILNGPLPAIILQHPLFDRHLHLDNWIKILKNMALDEEACQNTASYYPTYNYGETDRDVAKDKTHSYYSCYPCLAFV
jgi:hypothetical protein